MSTTGEVIRCRAAVAWEPGKPLSVEEVEVAPPKAHEVRIKVVATAVSSTDWAFLYKPGIETRVQPFPFILGCEAAGVVESVGPGVIKFLPGDRVIPLFLPQFGECDQCCSTKHNVCKKNWENREIGVLADGTSRISYNGQQIYQFMGISAFSQYTVVSDISLAKIRDDAPFDKVCLLGYAVSTGYSAARYTAKVKRGSLCAVIGLGAVGLAAIMGCKAAGATRIIGVDINSCKHEKAKELGATDVVNPNDHRESIQEVLHEMTNGGVDYAVVCVRKADDMTAALESTREGCGTCVITKGTETAMTIGVNDLLMGRTLKGAYFGGWKSVDCVPLLVEDYMNKKLKLDEFVTGNLSLYQINEALQLSKNEKSIRTVISLW
ncbi:alcohol dehydrogenase class-3-like [Genypterus blacodes]|uniref:alcohol dehydrogenase class-3-like n=1 Tax=Genypterus blacodes TaxID=154954 RepID=UPI003F75D51A